MTDTELASLASAGWFLREDFPGAAAASAGAADQSYVAAGLVSGLDDRVRNDAITWLESSDDGPFTGLFASFEALRVEINRDAWLGLARFDVQLARYAGGAGRYARHRDARWGADNRRLTAVAWLNPGWIPAHGGALRLHVDPVVDLSPRLGRLLVFLSAKVEHEVLPTFAPRFAATAFYYAT